MLIGSLIVAAIVLRYAVWFCLVNGGLQFAGGWFVVMVLVCVSVVC